MQELIFMGTLIVLGLLGTQAVYAQYDPAGPLPVSDTTPEPGDPVTVSGSGFDPGSEVKVTIESDPVLLATVTATASGSFSVDVTIPSSFTGVHTLEATGIAPDGSVRVLATQITIAGGELPDTSAGQLLKGLSDDTLVLGLAAAGVLLVTGTVLLLARRRPYGP